MNRPRVRPGTVALARAAGLAVLFGLSIFAASGTAGAAGPGPTPSGPQRLDQGQSSGKSARFITFGLQPAYPAGATPRATFNLVADPGTRQGDNLRVSNFSQQAVTLKVYAADARTAPDGGFEIAASAAKPVDVGKWVRFAGLDHGSLTLPGRSRLDVPFTLALPGNAEPGDHAGALVVAVTSKSRQSNGALVDVESRVATRLYLRVGGTLRPRLEIDDVKGSYAGTLNPLGRGRVRVTYTIRNTGNVRMAIDPSVRLSPLLGNPVVVQGLHEIPEILPGDAVRVTAYAAQVWPLVRYTVGVGADPKPVRDAVAANTLNAHAVSGHEDFWAVPWSLLGLLGAVFLVAAALGWWRRHRRRHRRSGRHARGGAPTSPPQRSRQRAPELVHRSSVVGARHVVATLISVAVVVFGGATAAQAGADGFLTFTPPTGKDVTPMYLVTSRACPVQATNVLARAYGKGFPADGQVVVSNSTSGMSHRAPFVLPLQDTMASYARQLNITLAGPYRVVLSCKPRLGSTAYATMTGTITFHTAHDYTAPPPTDAQVAAVTGQPGAQANGQLPPAAGQRGSGATKAPVTAPSGAPSTDTRGPGANAGAGTSSGSPTQTPVGSVTGAEPAVAHRNSQAMWWLSGAGVLLLAFGVVLALRSPQGGPGAPSQPADRSMERVA